MANRYIVVFVTCGSKDEARSIADSLLRKRLVACANTVSGIESKFWWKGRIDKATETLLILKAKKVNFRNIEKDIKRLHSYDVPEIIALPIVAGNREYLGWIHEAPLKTKKE